MKKWLSIGITLLILAATLPAFAAGRLRVEQENFYVIDSYSVYGYAFAKVANIGDKPIKVNTGLLEIFNADGDPLTSTDYASAYAKYLQPEEYTYVKTYDNVEDAQVSDVDDYMLTVTGKADTDYENLRLPVTTSYEPDVRSGYWTYNYMYAVVTNNTNEPLYDISVVLALLDASGNILFVDDASMYSDKALMPGSSMTVRKDVDSKFIEYFTKNGIKPSVVDAIAFVEISK